MQFFVHWKGEREIEMSGLECVNKHVPNVCCHGQLIALAKKKTAKNTDVMDKLRTNVALFTLA